MYAYKIATVYKESMKWKKEYQNVYSINILSEAADLQFHWLQDAIRRQVLK